MEKIKILELFAGSRSIGKIGNDMGFDVFSSDINSFEKIDYVIDILNFDVSLVPFVPDFIWASPPCTFFSVASIGHHWKIEKHNGKSLHIPKTENAILGIKIVQKTLDIIAYFQSKNPNLIFFIENPRGKLRKLDFMQEYPRTTIMYCQYGDTRMKPRDIWSNNIHSIFNPDGFQSKTCFNGNINCHHQPAPRGSKTGTQGLKGSYDRSKIPAKLCKEIIESVIKQKNK